MTKKQGKTAHQKQVELQAEIRKEQTERAHKCSAEIDALLKQHNCTLVCEVVFTEGVETPLYRKAVKAL